MSDETRPDGERLAADVLTLRDHFAALALSAITLESEDSDEDVARRCYERADAMLKEREGT